MNHDNQTRTIAAGPLQSSPTDKKPAECKKSVFFQKKETKTKQA